MGIPPQLLIDRKTEYKTLTGGILSLFIFIFYLLACFFFGEELFLRQNPTVLISSIYQEEPELFNLTKNNFGFFVGLQGSDYEYYIDPTIYSLNMRIRSKKSYLDENGKFKNEYKTKNFQLERCDLDKHFPNFQNQFKDQDLNNLLCPPKEVGDIQLKGSFDNSDYRWFDFSVRVCKNQTKSDDDKKPDIICKPKSEIDKKLQGGFFVINYIDTIFDHKDYKEPWKYIRKNFYTSMSNKFIKSMTFWLRNIEYLTDGGILFSEEEVKKFVNTEDIKEYYDIREADKFIGAVFRLSYTKEIIRRRYLKIQAVIAEVGGFVKGINIILSILFYFYTKMDFYQYLMNKLYRYDDENDAAKYKEMEKMRRSLMNSELKNIKFSQNNENNNLKNQNYSKHHLKSNQNVDSNANINNNDNIQQLRLNVKKKNSDNENSDNNNINDKNQKNLINDNEENNEKLNLELAEVNVLRKIRINQESRKEFSFCENFGILCKMCFPFRKTSNANEFIYYLSLEQIMDRFDCTRYLRIFEELKILKNILVGEERNKFINLLVKFKKLPQFDTEDSSNIDINGIDDDLKNIALSNKNKDKKLKRTTKTIGLI